MTSDTSTHNVKLIDTFYSHFKELNAEGMIACYHPDVLFFDPVFQELQGERVFAMWQMLCSKAQKFQLNYAGIQANELTGSARWYASYDFSATGRRIHNSITAKFEFFEGKIIKHHDNFNLWRWSSMALGAPGLVLGWSPIIRQKVRQAARENLHNFMTSNNTPVDPSAE